MRNGDLHALARFVGWSEDGPFDPGKPGFKWTLFEFESLTVELTDRCFLVGDDTGNSGQIGTVILHFLFKSLGKVVWMKESNPEFQRNVSTTMLLFEKSPIFAMLTRTIFSLLAGLLSLNFLAAETDLEVNSEPLPENVYLFSSFRGSGDGLHLSWSKDGKQWSELHGIFLDPNVGSGLFRDPHILKGQDPYNLYHMVWTTGWNDQGIGYATTRDFVHWSIPRFLPLMEKVEGTRNCWAPEIIYDETRDVYMITWSSDVIGRFPETVSEDRMNNRTYFVTTKDFKEFSEPKVLIEPGFDHIDLTITKIKDHYVGVIKEGDKQGKGEWGPIHKLTADDLQGPWELSKSSLLTERAEGPALAQLGGETLLYVDFYGAGHYGAYATSDWEVWRDVSDRVDTVEGQRHGSIIQIPSQLMDFMLVRNSGWEIETPESILPINTADPAIRVFGDRYYVYPTTDRPNWMTTEFNVWSSPNLVDWSFETTIIDLTKQISWANLRAWAPDCIERNGTYYFYFCGEGKIGVATAPTPTGPFKDALDRPLLERNRPEIKTNTIDPYAFIDDDGQAYLYWANGGEITQVYKLNEDMITLEEGPYTIPLRDCREGVVVFKRKGKYYFMWSIDDARSPNYRVGWGTADSPLGPVVTAEAEEDFIVLGKNGPVIGTAHHSVVNVPGTDRWYVAYHRHAIKNGGGYNRQTCLARMYFDEAGNILPMDPMEEIFQPGDGGEPIINGKGLPHDPLE